MFVILFSRRGAENAKEDESNDKVFAKILVTSAFSASLRE
jgi:hypothetical protein